MAKTKGPTPNEKAAANLQKAAAPSPATSDGRPVRQAKSTAYKNQVWMAEKSTNRKRAASNNAESEHIKMPRIVTSDAKSNTKVVSASELFDSDNDIAALSGDSNKHGTGDDSDDNLDASDDDLKSLKADKKKLKEVLDLEISFSLWLEVSALLISSHVKRPQFGTSDTDDDSDEPRTTRAAVSDRDDDMKATQKTHYRTPAPDKSKKTIKHKKPTWRDSTEDMSDTLVTASNPKLVRTREEDWPLSSWIIYSTSGKVNLTDQQAHMQNMLRASITRILEYLVFENAYPDLEHRRKITGDILLACTDDWLQCHFRNNVRKVAQAHVASHYGLIKGADMKVADLLKKNMFMYPVNSKDEPIRSKSYQAPAILDTIAEAFFVDDASVGVKFHEKLVSTVEDRLDERELPVAMVALAGTAVRSVIMQYSSEKYDRDFNCELYSGIYKTLVGILNVCARSIDFLVILLIVCDLETDEALMFLDIDAMPESEE
ncbi:uncharacterized protein HD556DRAFT_1496966 [Suillus plorans]|uniref:DUF6532 domain-containing protein n=1 Tax=Suillus plorans TaxID=116603 RepID=A0A9P7DDY2_9AGAM|nr:uncharacterized protein HD556DRAFT_1496966 [Suillus plorans]KAG1788596.1 hypothetical protein HD556DRAFT_1496966 [Suillus plorans]